MAANANIHVLGQLRTLLQMKDTLLHSKNDQFIPENEVTSGRLANMLCGHSRLAYVYNFKHSAGIQRHHTSRVEINSTHALKRTAI